MDIYDYNVWSHVDNVSESDLDIAMDVLHTICDRLHLDIAVYDMDDGTFDIAINGPEGIVRDAIEDYFKQT